MIEVFGFSFSPETVEQFVANYGLRLVGAIITLVAGWTFAKLSSRLTARVLQGTHLEAILTSFLSNLVYMFVLTFFIVSALNKLGVQTTSIVAVIGAAGLAIGLALQGSLSNFAAGIMIIIFRHFKIGDSIAVNTIRGKVVDMSIFTTTLHTSTNERVIVPNQFLTMNPLTNLTGNSTRRVDIPFTVRGEVPIEQVREMVAAAIAKENRVLSRPAYALEMTDLHYNGLRYVLRFWTKQEHTDSTRNAVLGQLVLLAQERSITLRP